MRYFIRNFTEGEGHIRLSKQQAHTIRHEFYNHYSYHYDNRMGDADYDVMEEYEDFMDGTNVPIHMPVSRRRIKSPDYFDASSFDNAVIAAKVLGGQIGWKYGAYDRVRMFEYMEYINDIEDAHNSIAAGHRRLSHYEIFLYTAPVGEQYDPYSVGALLHRNHHAYLRPDCVCEVDDIVAPMHHISVLTGMRSGFIAENAAPSAEINIVDGKYKTIAY